MEPLIAQALETRRLELDALLEREDLTDSERGSAIGEMGQLYQAHRLLEAAEGCYKQAWSLDQKSFSWPYYLGVLAARRGEIDVAAEAYERSLVLQPEDIPTMIRLGDLELERGNLDDASSLYSRARSIDDTLAAAEYGLGRVAAEKRDYTQAVAHFRQAILLQPSAKVIHYQLGQAYRQLGKKDLAESHLSKSGQRRVAMPDPELQKLTELTLGSSPHLTRGNAAFRDGQWVVAADEYGQALDADPENLRARQSLAMVLIRLGDTDGAAEQFEAAAVIAPANARVQSDLGTTLAQIGEDERALEHLRKAIDLEPDLERAHLSLANVLAKMGRDQEAAESYQTVIEIDPSNLQARARLGVLLIKTGRSDEGVEHLQVVVDRDPNDAQARLNLGMALVDTADPSGAIDQLNAVLELGLEGLRVAFVHFTLATLYEQSETLDQAVEHYVQAVRLEPQNETARFRYAVGLMKQEQYKAAKEVLEQAVVELPEAVHLRHALARLLAGAPDRSLREGRRALEMSAQVLQAERIAPHAETLAMALSETGKFEDAIQLQLSVLEEARELGRELDEERLARNLALYEAGNACCGAATDVYPAH